MAVTGKILPPNDIFAFTANQMCCYPLFDSFSLPETAPFVYNIQHCGPETAIDENRLAT